MSTSDIVTLKRKRGEIKARITRYRNYLSTAKSAPDADELQTRIDSLIEHFKRIYSIHEELVQLEPDQYDTYVEELFNLEEEYHLVLTDTKKLIRQAHETESRSTNDSNRAQLGSPATISTFMTTPKVKLPEITLPRFDGSIEKWHAFRDQFISRVDQNNDITPVDKLQYLQATLVGKAARAIESIENTAANYKEAWDILTTKYDNSRKAILQHWSILHSIPKLPKDTPEAIDELIDTFRQHIRALKGLGEPVQHWDSCLIYLMLSKINNHTRFQWETTLPDNKMPSFNTLLAFLEKRGNCSDSSIEIFNKDLKKYTNFKQTRSKTLVTNVMNSEKRLEKALKYTCPICKENHKIYQCKTFHSYATDKRIQAAENASLCTNCLGKGHSLKECKGGTCRQCDERHHTYLHKIPERIDAEARRPL